ncbi:putative gustatory receptor 98a [Drosophila montana]|uniref:putative gustatory receptor 98a n=1 Tax=Drosophila montana TaxID=40370 RepID=UPI00313D6F16
MCRVLVTVEPWNALVMWHVPGELDVASLRLMRGSMHCLLILPPRSHLYLKLLYNIALLVYIGFIFRWRYLIDQNIVFLDNKSRIVYLVGILELLVGHCVVAMELLWSNHSKMIEQQFQEIHDILCVRLGRKVNLVRIEGYCNVIYRFNFIRIAALAAVTIYSLIATNNFFLLCNLYSETLFALRCGEFTLHTVLVLAFFQELNDAANEILLGMERLRLDLCSDYCLSAECLAGLQQIHLLLWKNQRDIEHNFLRSLIVIIMKNFVDTAVILYWMFVNIIQKRVYGRLLLYALTEELGKLLQIGIPCWICTRCARLQRQFRSLFHGVTVNRQNKHMNNALLRISVQLAQETAQLSVGGFLIINNEMLGKFLFGMLSYFIVCIQFQLTFIDEDSATRLVTATEPNYPTYA